MLIFIRYGSIKLEYSKEYKFLISYVIFGYEVLSKIKIKNPPTILLYRK